MSDPPLKECPECGKEVRRLIFGGTGVIFKGSGFYVTDKGKSSKSVSKKTESSPCAKCPSGGASGEVSGGDAGKCPVAASEVKSNDGSSSGKVKPESKSA